mmetsp:Transcript_41733/g.119769  ORF Transcript_41733/g.119769 Transcript_41733/m.119769 type:complete len:453 (-) Transcript_41733:754-2112(-)
MDRLLLPLRVDHARGAGDAEQVELHRLDRAEELPRLFELVLQGGDLGHLAADLLPPAHRQAAPVEPRHVLLVLRQRERVVGGPPVGVLGAVVAPVDAHLRGGLLDAGVDADVHRLVDLLQHVRQLIAESAVTNMLVGQMSHLSLEIEHHHLLRTRRPIELQVLDERWARRGVHNQGHEGDASHVEQHSLGLVLSHLPASPIQADLDREGEAQGTAEAAPTHDGGVGDRHGLAGGVAYSVEDRYRGDHKRPTHEGADDVEDQQVAVVFPAHLDHHVAGERPGHEEDDAVAAVLQHVPHVVHGLLAHDARPHPVRQNQGARHAAEHAAYLERALGSDEAEVGAAQRDRNLDQAAAVHVQPVGGPLDPGSADVPDHHAEYHRAHHGLDEEDYDVPSSVLDTPQHIVGHGKEDDGGAVVEEGLALDLDRERWGGAELLQKADHRHGVGGGQDGRHG